MPAPQEDPKHEYEAMAEDLKNSEKQAWEEFFGREVDVSTPPPMLFDVLARAKELDIHTFVPYYLPKHTFTQEDELPGWKYKPGNQVTNFWYHLYKERIEPTDAATLRGEWILWDSIKRPDLEIFGKQLHLNDPLGPMLAELRETGQILPPAYQLNRKYFSEERYEKERIPLTSRYEISTDELDTLVYPSLAAQLGVASELVGSPRAIEFNVLGNRLYPQLARPSEDQEPESDTREWMSDKINANFEYAPYSLGENQIIYHNLTASRLDQFGHMRSDSKDRYTTFRPVIRFPSEG